MEEISLFFFFFHVRFQIGLPPAVDVDNLKGDSVKKIVHKWFNRTGIAVFYIVGTAAGMFITVQEYIEKRIHNA